MEIYLSTFYRTITIMLILLFLTVFVMGKKSIGELPVYDTLTVIVLGNVVGAVIVDQQIEHLPTIFAVVLLAFLDRAVTKLSLKYKKIRRKISFEPTIIINNGQILFDMLKKIGYSIDDVLMFLRQKDCFDISQVQFAIIEANGDLSILKKPEYGTLTVKDLNLQPSTPLIPHITIIVDGEFQKENIKILNTSEDKIKEKLAKKGFTNLKEIFYASMDGDGNVNISPYKN